MAAALQGRALAVAGRLDEARALLLPEVARHPGEVEVALALADVARLQGNADEALRLFADVAAARPGSHEAWFGVGRIANEKEDLKPARGALDTAIRLAPDAPGYHGELATLEVLSGDYAAARSAFDEALRRQPDDYLAWTGLGILQLKMGQSEAALESFLKAGVLEPRFARAQLYTGVAYYRLENTPRAIEALNKAAELDPKDPLPYVMLGLIHGDALELRAATDAARAAQERMPNLKSLNQVANNQKGSANVGSALAAQGMEEWARAYASSSYNPYWAGSALFLAYRNPDGFNKNTELYKGFLLDPTVFGASNRNSSMVQTPGHYGSVAYIGSRSDFSQQTIQGKANGLHEREHPLAYSVTAEYADGHDTRPAQGLLRGARHQSDGGPRRQGPPHELGVFCSAPSKMSRQLFPIRRCCRMPAPQGQGHSPGRRYRLPGRPDQPDMVQGGRRYAKDPPRRNADRRRQYGSPECPSGIYNVIGSASGSQRCRCGSVGRPVPPQL
ncbi:MAG: tetratricopeptide repeat protein [Sulfuritalea sp.]|nr:tetratricopeptide repeat protein [Sulfuritalea sp.]